MDENKTEKVYMTGFKGYEKGLICQPDANNKKQYTVGETAEESGGDICESGMMHFCKNAHGVFEHYAPGDQNEFTTVEALGECVTDDDEKYATNRLKIGAKITPFDICRISVRTYFQNFDFENKIAAARNSNESNAGNCGAANAGYRGAANAGNYGAAVVRFAGLASVGERGVAIGFGHESAAKGALGSVIVLIDTDDGGNISAVKSVKITGNRYKPDTYYTLRNGKIEEA